MHSDKGPHIDETIDDRHLGLGPTHFCHTPILLVWDGLPREGRKDASRRVCLIQKSGSGGKIRSCWSFSKHIHLGRRPTPLGSQSEVYPGPLVLHLVNREFKSMLLEKVSIRDFRGIENREIDFTDSLGRVRSIAPIAGPNTSGKTSVLDAISLCLMSVTEMFDLPTITLSPAALVRRGASQAKVSCTIRFSQEEIDAVKDVVQKAGLPYADRIPDTKQVTVHWEYPDRTGKHRLGFYKCTPRDGWTLFKGRVVTQRNRHISGISRDRFRLNGGVFQIDQQRQGLAKRIPPVERELMNASMDERYLDYSGEGNGPREFTDDPKIILVSLATRASFAQDQEATQKQDFARLRELYATVCRPHTIKGLYNTDTGLDMEFSGPDGVYGFHGLSSGQQMILLLLLNFATKHIHRSIVMIDELELHLHPLWQDRLYQSLDKLGVENQIIFTTHSSHLRKSIGRDILLSTGELETPQAQGNAR